MKLCMFRPVDTPMQRGWVGRLDGVEVVHLAAQTLQHFFIGGGSAREHARYPLSDIELLLPLPWPPSVRVFDEDGSFEFANPAAVVGPSAVLTPPPGAAVVADVGLAGLVGSDEVVAVSPAARLRASALPPPKDRDFGIVLGPWFTTLAEAPVATDLMVTVDAKPHAAALGSFDWETARGFAGENTRLRVGDLLLAPAAVVVDLPAGSSVTIASDGHGPLSFATAGEERTP
jgi:hypothetical protein